MDRRFFGLAYSSLKLGLPGTQLTALGKQVASMGAGSSGMGLSCAFYAEVVDMCGFVLFLKTLEQLVDYLAKVRA